MSEKQDAPKKNISEDLERLLKDAWAKVVEYASIGAEEATRMSATAKVRVDIETLRFKRGKLLKTLGERYYIACSQDPDLGVAGTKDSIRQIRSLDQEIAALEKSLAETRRRKEKEPRDAAAKKMAAEEPSPSKTPRRPSASRGKSAAKKKTSSEDKT